MQPVVHMEPVKVKPQVQKTWEQEKLPGLCLQHQNVAYVLWMRAPTLSAYFKYSLKLWWYWDDESNLCLVRKHSIPYVRWYTICCDSSILERATYICNLINSGFCLWDIIVKFQVLRKEYGWSILQPKTAANAEKLLTPHDKNEETWNLKKNGEPNVKEWRRQR